MLRKKTVRLSGKTSRFFFIALGWIMVGLGILGAALPILPTTPFILVAVWAFARSSPRFEQWVLDHKTFGPLTRNWRERGAIPKHAKILACTMMAFSYAIFWFFTEPGLFLALLVALILLFVALFLVTRPN